jgi:hypothetical protein
LDEIVTVHVDPALLASATGPARLAQLTHLRGCAACRRLVAAQDPSALFALLALAPMPAPVLDDVSVGVARRAGTMTAANAGLAAHYPWPRRTAAAAVFTLVLLSGYATLHDQPALPPQAQAQAAPQRADVAVDSGRGVSQVIDLTVGETQLVMVYNGELKL